MSKIEIKYPHNLPSTGACSEAILSDGWLFISGQGPLDLSTGEVVHGTIENETLLTLSHIKKITVAAGGGIEDIVKCTVHLSELNDFERFNAVYSSFFHGTKPARTTVQSGLLGGIKIEIDAVARIERIH